MRAQTSIEFLLILAVALLALLSFMVLTQSETAGMGDRKIQKDASNAVSDLGSAAADVYAQGAGAKKQVVITIPFGYEPSESFVGQRSIKMRVAGSDFISQVDFDVYGSLPNMPGYHAVWVESEGGKVKIGTAMISADVDSINAVMGENDTRTWRFTLFNTWNNAINVAIKKEWEHENVSLSLSQESFAISQGGFAAVAVTFSPASGSSGFFPGSLGISADDGYFSENMTMPVSAEVVSGTPKRGGPPLMIIPSRWNETLSRNEVRSATFDVCTNSGTRLGEVEFTGSIGEPGSWVEDNESIGPIDYGVCHPKSLTIHVPGNAEPGNYSGYVFLEGDAPGAVDSLAIGIVVGGSAHDADGPLVTDISVFPATRNIYVQDPVTIRATADDSGTGNNTIASCDLKIDSGPWVQMIATDGEFDEPVENVSYGFFGGFGMGEHTAYVKCTDVKNNTGPEQSRTFRIMKEFLFVTQNATPDADEQAWISWIRAGYSQEGYAWNVDHTDYDSLYAGLADLDDYSVLVLEKWTSGMASQISSFAYSGKTAVLLGESLSNGPSALGLSVQGNNPGANDTYIQIVGAHYITEGYSGDTAVFGNATMQGRFWKDLYGTLLAKSPSGAPPHYHVLAVSDNIYLWGPYSPNGFNAAGISITCRVLDHAVNASARS